MDQVRDVTRTVSESDPASGALSAEMAVRNWLMLEYPDATVVQSQRRRARGFIFHVDFIVEFEDPERERIGCEVRLVREIRNLPRRLRMATELYHQALLRHHEFPARILLVLVVDRPVTGDEVERIIRRGDLLQEGVEVVIGALHESGEFRPVYRST